MQILEGFVLYCLNYDTCTENLAQSKQLMNITCDMRCVQDGYGKTN